MRTILSFVLFIFALPAYAHVQGGVEAHDLTTLQRMAGYLTWLGFFKGLGAIVLAVGCISLTWGILAKVLYSARVLLEVLAYAASIALIVSGHWVGEEAMVWTVLTGCILFAGTVFATLWIHDIKGDDPKGLAALFAVVWGAVAIYYNLSEVGILTMLAVVTLLGFSVVVTPLCYAFGFNDEKLIPTSTAAALYLLFGFVAVHVAVPDAPAAVQVFKSGAFWVGSFVAFTGVLIMSVDFYSRGAGAYWLMQVIAVVVFLGGVALGLSLAITPLAGMAGTFLVLYLAIKPFELRPDDRITVGLCLIFSGSIMYGAWYYATKHIDDVHTFMALNL